MTPITMMEAVIWPPAADRGEIARVAAFPTCVAGREGAWPRGHMSRRTNTAIKAHESRHLVMMRSAAEKNKAASIFKSPQFAGNRHALWPQRLRICCVADGHDSGVRGVAAQLRFDHHLGDQCDQGQDVSIEASANAAGKPLCPGVSNSFCTWMPTSRQATARISSEWMPGTGRTFHCVRRRMRFV